MNIPDHIAESLEKFFNSDSYPGSKIKHFLCIILDLFTFSTVHDIFRYITHLERTLSRARSFFCCVQDCTSSGDPWADAGDVFPHLLHLDQHPAERRGPAAPQLRRDGWRGGGGWGYCGWQIRLLLDKWQDIFFAFRSMRILWSSSIFTSVRRDPDSELTATLKDYLFHMFSPKYDRNLLKSYR